MGGDCSAQASADESDPLLGSSLRRPSHHRKQHKHQQRHVQGVQGGMCGGGGANFTANCELK